MYLGKRKSGIYFIEFFDDSILKMRRVSTGSRTKSDALKFLSSFKEDLREQQIEKHRKGKRTLSAFRVEYIDFMSDTHSKKYLVSIRLAFRKFEEFLGKENYIKRISQKDAQIFVSETYKRTKYSASLYLRTLKAAFTRAVEWEYITANPFKKVRLPKIPQNLPVYINKDELKLILENSMESVFKDILITAFYTGMRLGEILNLKWESVDITSKVILVKNDGAFTTKSKKERTIPINENLLNILTLRQSKLNGVFSNYVFKNSKGFRLNESYVSKNFKKAVRSSGFDERIHFHTLRHSFASNLVQKGVSLYVVKELLGHENITTTQVYSHLSTDNLFQAVHLL
jgi:site-specific recombinase XerD